MPEFGSIIFPLGAGGNHLRWLLFLDQRFGSLDSNYNSTPADKIQFIKDKIYTVDRSWNNWLHFEWQYRDLLDPLIRVSHADWNLQPSSSKELYLDFKNRELPFEHYYHINLGLNSATPDVLKKYGYSYPRYSTKGNPQIDNAVRAKIESLDNKKIVFADSIFEHELSKTLYQDIIQFFGFDDHYEDANAVHQLYYQCRVKSARDFYEYFTGNEFAEYLEIMRKKGYPE